MIPPLTVTELGGTGEVLVLGPSLGTSAATLWADVAARVGDRFRVLAWDLPGHGAGAPATDFTIADLAAAVLREVPGPFRYAGVSVGGAVGLQLLLDAPGRVTSAVLLSTGARIATPDVWRDRAARVSAGGTAVLLDETPARWFAADHRDLPAARALLDDLAACDAAGYAAVCDALAAFDVRERVATIATPVLAVAGADDPVTPPASLRRIADGVQHGRLVVVDGASHQLPVEAPDAVASALTADLGSADVGVAELRAEGMAVRRAVLGDEYVDRAGAAVDATTEDFQRFITTYAWGSVWTRPGLDRRSRSLITLTALVAGGHHAELAAHLRGALRNGLTRAEVVEALLQTAIYCGVPAANTAFGIARDVFADLDGPDA